MSQLTKTIAKKYVAAFAGYPGFPGYPEKGPYWVKTCTVRTVMRSKTDFPALVEVPVSAFAPDGYVVSGFTAISYDTEYVSKEYTVEPSYECFPGELCRDCAVQYMPGYPAAPARPAISPTLAEFSTDFQEGWNSSAQASTGILPGSAYAFTVMNGTRGILACVEPATWVPNIVTARYGIMFNAGGFSGYPSTVTAVVWENGTLKGQLGTFVGGKTFLIGRSTDNKIVYRNMTQSIQVISATKPVSSVPLNLFSQLYLGGDTIYA